MPRIFKKKYGTKSGVYKSKKRLAAKSFKKYTSSKAVVPRNQVTTGVGLPKRLTVTHKYRELIALTSTLGVINSYIWRTNGMFDPNVTGTGHQPMYFDQLSALYNHYVVIGSKCHIILTPTTTTSSMSRITCFVNDDSTLASANMEAISESTQGKQIKYFAAANNNIQHLYMNWSAKKMFGGSVLSNPVLAGTPGTDPSEQSTYVLAVQASNAATIEYQVTVEIEYIAVWKELKELASS